MRFQWEYASSLLSEYDEDWFLGIQIDGYGELQSDFPTSEAIHPQGFAGRPRDPDEEGAGSCLCLYQGDQRYVFSLQDPRAVNGARLPPIAKGSSIQYGDRGPEKGPSFYLIDGDNGTHTAYYEFEDGSVAHLFTFGVDDNGDPIIELVHGDGQGLALFKGKTILKNKSGNVYLELNDDGTVHNGNLKVNGALEANGATITPTGDVITSGGVSLQLHTHPTAMGPSGPPIPTPL